VSILQYQALTVTNTARYIFQDLVTAGDLMSYLEKKNGRLIENEAAHIIRQIIIAVKFLHERNIVHRDIKPENILMTTLAVGCRVVLTDFGEAKKIASHQQRMVSMVGTAGYHAPYVFGPSTWPLLKCHREIEMGGPGSKQGYSKAVDLWSIGCVTVVLLTGGSPFRDSQTNQYSAILARDCNLTELERSSDWAEISARPKAFVMKLLLLDESRRLTAEEALLDAWFNNDFLKPDFEDLYKRTIRHWQTSIRKKPIIEFMNAHEVKQFQCSQNVLASERRSQGRRGQIPIEPPVSHFIGLPFPFLSSWVC
jgi:serine/threonine protein kinase